MDFKTERPRPLGNQVDMSMFQDPVNSLHPPTFGAFGETGGPPVAMTLLQEQEAEEEARRNRESEQIARLYEAKLQERAPNRTMSPDYVAAQPTSMRAKLRVTPEEEETILFHYAATSSLARTRELAGSSDAKVRAVVYAPDLQASLAGLREAMRVSVIRKIEETQTILLDALQDSTKLEKASLSQISDILAQVSETHLNLVQATRSARISEVEVDPTSVFSGDELEYMAFLRRRLSAKSPSALPYESPSATSSSPDGGLDDFLDPSFSVSETIEISVSADQDDHADPISS